ncbi:MAG: xanthine dehydrogenase family protein subunit M [Chloroflexi bacterium]|nr:xanthine dehydrogenase family protein subunit M [Chloroflexota bacterium]
MIPAAFELKRPASVAEAVDLLRQYGDDAKLLAGGHSLLPLLKLRLAEPKVLIDLARVGELRGIREEGGELVIAAMTTHYEVLSSPLVQRLCPLLAETAAHIGDPQVRNRGAIGGSLAHADPGADLPAALLATGASVRAVGPNGARTIAASDLFVDMLTTSLAPDEVLTEVRVPVQTAGQGGAYEKFAQPASRFALVGAAALVTVQSGQITAARVALTGAAPCALRLSAVEAALIGETAAVIPAAAALAAVGWEPNEDMHAGAEYRRHLATVMVRRALERAVAVAQGQAQPVFGLL